MDKYKEKIQSNLISILKVDGDELHVLKKQFDKDTGEEIESMPDVYLKSSLLIRKEQLEQELADVNEMLKEFK